MKRLIFSFFIFLVSFFIFSVTSVSAMVLTSKNGSVNVPKGQIINDDLFVGAQTANIDGTVNGDVFIAAQTVKIAGIINGSLHIGAQTVDLNGPVKGSIYIGAQQITIANSDIGGSVIIGSQNADLAKGTAIGGSVIAGVATLTIDGTVARNVYAGTGMLTVGPDARITKNVYYASAQNVTATIDKGAKIGGQVIKSVVKTAEPSVTQIEKKAPAIITGGLIAFNLVSFIAALFVGLLYMKLFAWSFTVVRSVVQRFFWKSMGIGFLVSIAFVPVMLILLLTVIGIPIAGLAVLILLIFSYMAKIVVGAALGSWIAVRAEWKMSPFWSFALGLLIIYVFKIIPVIGFLTGVAVLWTGLGALTLHLFQ